MEMEKSKVLIQFLVVFRQFGDVLFFLYARRLRGYTATVAVMQARIFFMKQKIQELCIEKSYKVSMQQAQILQSFHPTCKIFTTIACKLLTKLIKNYFPIFSHSTSAKKYMPF